MKVEDMQKIVSDFTKKHKLDIPVHFSSVRK